MTWGGGVCPFVDEKTHTSKVTSAGFSWPLAGDELCSSSYSSKCPSITCFLIVVGIIPHAIHVPRVRCLLSHAFCASSRACYLENGRSDLEGQFACASHPITEADLFCFICVLKATITQMTGASRSVRNSCWNLLIWDKSLQCTASFKLSPTERDLGAVPDCVITCRLSGSDAHFTQIASTHLMNCFHIYKSASLASHRIQFILRHAGFFREYTWNHIISHHIPSTPRHFQYLVSKGSPACLSDTRWVDVQLM